MTLRRRRALGAVIIVIPVLLLTGCKSTGLDVLARASANASTLGFVCTPRAPFNGFPFTDCVLNLPDGRLNEELGIYGRADGTLAGLDLIVAMGGAPDPRAATRDAYEKVLDGVADDSTRSLVLDAIAHAGPAESRISAAPAFEFRVQVGGAARASLLATDLAAGWGHPIKPGAGTP